MNLIINISIVLLGLTIVTSNPSPHGYNPYYKFFKYDSPYFNYGNYGNYGNQLPNYSPYYSSYPESYLEDPEVTSYLSTPDVLPTLNILAEVPYSITSRFTVVPLLVVSKDNMNMVTNAQILSVSKKRPVMTIKTEKQNLMQCTPAVKIILEKPMTIYSLKTSILFPSEIQIVHRGFKIPIAVGAIIAPIAHNTYVSAETPIAIRVIYAVPTRPVTIDYVNNNDIIDIPETQAVVVESEPNLAPPNITIIDFPDKEAEPVIAVDEGDEELVNRNPPTFLAPGGIVQSTQPFTHIEPFINSKESPVLIALREESKKRL